MEQLQKENLTLGLTGPEVTYREATAQGAAGGNGWKRLEHSVLLEKGFLKSPLSSIPSTVNLIVVLGALTFGLQLCLVLFLISRCQRLDNRIRDALKRPETAGKGDGEFAELQLQIQKERSRIEMALLHCPPLLSSLVAPQKHV